MKNPFTEVYLWIRGELLDIDGIRRAMAGRDMITKLQQGCEQKKRECQQELEKVSMGKFTFRSMLKSQQEKDAHMIELEAKIQQCNYDFEEYRKLLNFLTIFQGQTSVELFKKHKVAQYVKMIKMLSIKTVANAELAAQLNKTVLDLHLQ